MEVERVCRREEVEEVISSRSEGERGSFSRSLVVVVVLLFAAAEEERCLGLLVCVEMLR